MTLNVAPETVGVELSVGSVGTTEVERKLAEVIEPRGLSECYNRDSAKELKALAKSLVAENVPLRDIGEILGISHQRVHPTVRT